MEKIIKVSGMHCRSCEMLLTDVISEISGVNKVEANYSKGTIKVVYDNENVLPLVKKAIEEQDYKVI